MNKLSVVLATRNEEKHIGDCIRAVGDIAGEIVVVDEFSSDKTREIAKSLGAKVYTEPHHAIFHITKQKAINLASGGWILQLDADERVTPGLAKEILRVIKMTDKDLTRYENSLPDRRLFNRHKKLLEERDGKMGTEDGNYVAFLIPRRNFFLGKYLKYGGTYPDGVIRLFKKGMAYLPCKDVHEQMVVKGRVGWLQGHLLHLADTTFSRYLKRNNDYINLLKEELKSSKTPKNIFVSFDYLLIKPVYWFFLTQIRHKGILDGWQGIIFSFFSALRFPRAYLRYLKT